MTAGLTRQQRKVAEKAGTTPEAVAIEILRDCLLPHRSRLVSRETSPSGVGLPRPPENARAGHGPQAFPDRPAHQSSSEILP